MSFVICHYSISTLHPSCLVPLHTLPGITVTHLPAIALTVTAALTQAARQKHMTTLPRVVLQMDLAALKTQHPELVPDAMAAAAAVLRKRATDAQTQSKDAQAKVVAAQAVAATAEMHAVALVDVAVKAEHAAAAVATE